jgi:hypothetical protein
MCRPDNDQSVSRVKIEQPQPDTRSSAITWLRRSIETNRNYPWTHFVLAAALARLGRLSEACSVAQARLAIDPAFTIARYRAGAFSDNPTYLAGRERLIDGMRKAGVPEE